MTITANAITAAMAGTNGLAISVEDYTLLAGHGFTRTDQMAEMMRILPYVETMTETQGTHVRALEVDTTMLDLGEAIADDASVRRVWGIMGQLRRYLGHTAVQGRYLRNGKFRVTAEIVPDLSADKLRAVADLLTFYHMDVN